MSVWLERTWASRLRRSVAVTVAAVVGFAGAATVTAFASPDVPVHALADLHAGGDGRTRLVVSVPGGVTDVELAALRSAPSVDTAQRNFDGTALVAGFGITAPELTSQLPGATVEKDPTGAVLAATAPVTDPLWPSYGWDLANTGSNFHAHPFLSSATPGDDIDATAGWTASTGRGQVIAVIDTGYDDTHPELSGALWTNPKEVCGSTVDNDGDGLPGDCHGWNYYAGTANIDGDPSTPAGAEMANNAHGLAVSSIAAGRRDNGTGSAGVAPDATIMPLPIGAGRTGLSLTAAVDAIHYAADHGATIINASWAFWGDPSIGDQLRSAIEYANSKGVLVVAAAGNDGQNRDTNLQYPASLREPNLVVVGNSSPNDTQYHDRNADGTDSYSAYGPNSVDLFAPGDYIVSAAAGGSYMLMSGTSMASPEVAGAAALYRDVYPGETPTQIKARIMGDVAPVPALKALSVTGGRLSLTALGNTAGTVSYTFSGMTAEPGTVAPTVVVDGIPGAGAYQVQLGLGMEYDGQTYALADEPITVGGTTVNTGADGMATFDLGQLAAATTQVISPSMPLDDGRYLLTARLLHGDQQTGPAHAAPLLVSADPATVAPTPGSPVPSDPSTGTQPGATDPSTSTPGTSTPGTSTPGTSNPGTPNPGTTNPGTSNPGTPNPGTTNPGTTNPGTPNPGTTKPGTSNPGTSDPGTTNPGTPNPGTSNPGTTSPGTTNPGTSNPGTSDPGTTDPSTSDPGTGGQKDYPGTDAFGLTSISPTRVSTAGGDLVTITGTNIPSGARVRIGANTGITPESVSAGQLTFHAPALIAGTYDVFVFNVAGTQSVQLSGALTYVDTGAAQPGSTSPGDGSQPGTSDPGTSNPGTSDPGTSNPGTSDPGTSNPGSGSQPGEPSPGSGSQPGPDSSTPSDGVITGPHGEHLRYSAMFASLGASIWKVDCSSSCAGLAV